jgi:hypothetical protein
MNYSFHPGLFRRGKELQRIFHRVVVGKAFVVKSHPVGIVQDGNIFKGTHQLGWSVKIEFFNLYLASEGTPPVR